MKIILIFLSASIFLFSAAWPDYDPSKMPEGLIDSILSAGQRQADILNDMVFDATLTQKKLDGDGELKEIKEYKKRIYARKYDDGWRVYEEFLEYIKDGEVQSAEVLAEEAEKKRQEKEKRGNRDLTFELTEPFKMLYTGLYNLRWRGVSDEKIGGYECYIIDIEAREESDSLINATYFVDTATYHIVRADFQPAKLAKGLMFKMKEFDMSMHYEPYDDDIWLPRRFHITGKGKAALFINVSFEIEELYTDPVINSGLDDSMFDKSD